VLRGFTYTVIRLDLRQAEFQGGLPDISVLMKGRKLYDPRTGVTAWSQNPALVIYDYLTSEMCGVDPADLPTGHFITAANVCDEQIQGLC
jgi:predicted phage tail protein